MNGYLLKSAIFATAITVFASLPASAKFEEWTNRDGKSVELELVGLKGEGPETEIEFRNKAGKAVVIKIADLQEADQARALELGKLLAAKPEIVVKEIALADTLASGGSGKDKAPRKKRVRIEFDLRRVDHAIPQSLKIEAVKVGKRESKTPDWGLGYGEKGGKTTIISLGSKVEFDEADIAGVEIRGSLVLQVSAEKKNAESLVKLPRKQGDKVKVELGPFQVNLVWDSNDRIIIDAESAKRYTAESSGFVVNGQRGRGPERAAILGEEAKLAITYSEKVREVELPFSVKIPKK